MKRIVTIVSDMFKNDVHYTLRHHSDTNKIFLTATSHPDGTRATCLYFAGEYSKLYYDGCSLLQIIDYCLLSGNNLVDETDEAHRISLGFY